MCGEWKVDCTLGLALSNKTCKEWKADCTLGLALSNKTCKEWKADCTMGVALSNKTCKELKNKHNLIYITNYQHKKCKLCRHTSIVDENMTARK